MEAFHSRGLSGSLVIYPTALEAPPSGVLRPMCSCMFKLLAQDVESVGGDLRFSGS